MEKALHAPHLFCEVPLSLRHCGVQGAWQSDDGTCRRSSDCSIAATRTARERAASCQACVRIRTAASPTRAHRRRLLLTAVNPAASHVRRVAGCSGRVVAVVVYGASVTSTRGARRKTHPESNPGLNPPVPKTAPGPNPGLNPGSGKLGIRYSCGAVRLVGLVSLTYELQLAISPVQRILQGVLKGTPVPEG